MKLRTLLGAGILIGATVLITSEVFSRDAGTATAPAQRQGGDSGPGADVESQIETLVRYAMPGKHHRLLNQMAGSWDTVTRYWPNPVTPPVQAEGTSQRKWILGGRFLLEELDGGDLALPFRGLGLYGYDRFERKYTSAWVDSMSTAIMTNRGTYDEANRVVNFVGRYGDPWTGVKKKSRGVTRFVNDNKHVLDLYVQEADGRESKLLEIVYTRKSPERDKNLPQRE